MSNDECRMSNQITNDKGRMTNQRQLTRDEGTANSKSPMTPRLGKHRLTSLFLLVLCHLAFVILLSFDIPHSSFDMGSLLTVRFIHESNASTHPSAPRTSRAGGPPGGPRATG